MAGLFGLGGSSNSQKPVVYGGIQFSSSRLDLPLPVFWGQRRLGTNALWYNDFQQHAQSQGGKGGGKGGGGKGGGTQYTYTAATITGLCEGPIDSIAMVWNQASTNTTTSLAALNQTLLTGTSTQAVWSYLATYHPDQALPYARTAYLASPYMDLGSSATIPDIGYECVRSAGFGYTHTSTKGWKDPNTGVQYTAIDVLLSDVIYDLLTNPQYGMGFSTGDIGSLTQYAAYQRAQGLFFSPFLNTQTKATEVLNRWAQLSNSWIYWSGTQLQFVPLGDSAITANGVTYTPDTGAAYDLGPGDFLGDVPVKVNRVDPADCYNKTTLTIIDRTIGYASNPIEYKDQTLVDQYGLRDSSSTQADDICDPDVGAIVAQLIGKRAAYIRNTYQFQTSYRYIRCLPGTVLTLTDPNIGLNKARVRVKSIEEDDNGSLSFTAEEFPSLIGTYATTSPQGAQASPTPNLNASPGNINTPAIFEPDAAYTSGTPKIIVSASGGQNWGGCHAYISFNGTDYSMVGEITTPAVQGVLTANLANHADPDTTNTLAVDCTQSRAVPVPVSHADADALRTIAWVSAQPALVSGDLVVPVTGELLAFGDVSATGSYSANLTYLRRGEYGFAPSSHTTGDQFTVLNALGNSGSSLSYDLPPQYIGSTVYLKFTSYNVFGNAEQDISSVDTYSYVPTGLGYGGGTGGVPQAPTGVTVTPSVYGTNEVAWAANAAVDNVTNYSVYRANGTGASFGSATLQWTGNALAWSDVSVVAGTAYTYFLVASNVVGNSSPSTGVNATAISSSVVGSSAGSISLTGAINGTNTTFTMSTTVPGGALPLLSVNGTPVTYTTDYTISGTTLTMTTAPTTGTTLVLTYYYFNYDALVY